LSKAFDAVDKDITIRELKNIGCSNDTLKLMHSYLSDRKQYVCYKNEKSTILPLKLGLPQGSCYSPNLFGVTTNKFSKKLTHAIALEYADDINAIIIAETEEELLEKIEITVAQVHDFCEEQKLILNTEKTTFMQFHTKKNEPDRSYLIKVNGQIIKRSVCSKLLGTYIHESLDWNNHVNELCNKINTGIFMLFRLRTIVLQASLLSAYYGHIYNNISNGMIFWGGDNVYLERMFKLQKRAVRTILNLSKTESCKGHFKKLDLLTLPAFFILKCATFKKKHPEYYIQNDNIHDYNTRNRKKTVVIKHKSGLLEKSPHYMTAKVYDFLPNRIRNIESYVSFKNQLKALLITKEYYTIKQYFSNKISENDDAIYV
jgi:hypothetical protein